MHVCVSLFGGECCGYSQKSEKGVGPLGAGDTGSQEARDMDPRV